MSVSNKTRSTVHPVKKKQQELPKMADKFIEKDLRNRESQLKENMMKDLPVRSKNDAIATVVSPAGVEY